MESAKFWPALFVLVLAVASLFGFRYMELYDEANRRAVDLRLVLSQSEDSLIVRKAMCENSEKTALEVQQELQKAANKHQEASKIQQEADSKERLVSGDLAYLTKSMKTSVEKVRADTIGIAIPELQLANGKSLQRASIKKIDDFSASVLHANGLTAVSTSDLPAELIEKFDVGPASLTKQLESLEVSIGLQKSPVVKGDDSKLVAIQKRMAHLEVQIDHATKYKDKLEREVATYDEEAKKAEANGIPTINIRTMKDIAEGNAGMARIQLRQLQTEYEKVKIENASLGKNR